jgi:Ca-activated chloride channel homolog
MLTEFTLKNGWIEPAHWTSCQILLFWFRPTILLCAALYAPLAPAQQTPTASSGSIQVEVQRVNVGVIVTDAKGHFVEGLQRADFQIFDGAEPQPITDFAPVDTPAQVLLLLEAGPAVYLLQDSHLFVAQALLNGLSSGDSVAIASYNDAATALLNYTTDKQAVASALNNTQFILGYGDLNLARSLNTVLDWLVRVPGKKSIVLVSTGVDTSPADVMQSLLSRLQTGDVRIFAVSMSGPLRNGKRGTKRQVQQTEQAFDQADAWLKTLATSTGGRAYFPESPKAFQQTYQQIAQLVRHEYSLAFAPPKPDGAVHLIDVKVIPPADTKNPPPQYAVDHRRAYIAPNPPPQP